MRTEFPPIARLPCLMDSYIAQVQYVIPSSIKRERQLWVTSCSSGLYHSYDRYRG